MKLLYPIKFSVVLSLILLFAEGTVLPKQKAVLPQSTANCLAYEPVVVELTGTIVRETFPGPPNYESIKEGDRPETSWVLNLPQPICVGADETNPDLNFAQADIRRIQLVFMNPKAYKTYKPLVGKKVVAKGTLYGAHTIHHRTSVLLTVISITKAE